jgi:hypothetical protein
MLGPSSRIRMLAVLAALIAVRATASVANAAAGSPNATSGSSIIVSVLNFGAKCNGATDDTTAIRAAAAAVPESGAVLSFPKGKCAIHGTIYVKSHTHVQGDGSTLLAAVPWTHDHAFGYALLENVHHDPGDVRDADISVSGMTFDYGDFGPVVVPGGGKHAVRFDFADDVSVTDNVFYVRGGEDAVAGLGVANMLVRGNSAFEFRNCAYDFWYGPSNVSVIGNSAQTTTSAQMVSFNPERTAAEGGGFVAKGFVLSGNTFVATGSKAVPIQIEPLGPQTSVRGVAVTDNKLRNVFLVLRGDVRDATIRGNTITDVEGGDSVFETYPFHGATPESIKFSNNVIVEPHTRPGEMGVVRMEAKYSEVTGNSIAGSKYHSTAIYHGKFSGVEQTNNVHP